MRRERPDVVLVALDAVRRDHLSCYGYERPTTPSIDGLASEGTRYTRAWATSCWTIPAHASLFTGTYPSTHGADLEAETVPPGLPTLAEVLASRGYATASFSCNGFVTEHTGLTRGFDRSVDVDGLAGGTEGLAERIVRALHRRWKGWTDVDRGARRATRMARRWIRERADDEPFFLFLNYMECHLPYRLRRKERYAFLPSEARKRADAVPQDPFAVMAGEGELSDRELEDLVALYDGCLRYMDGQVGLLREELERRGRLEDTVFIVTADHGESFGEHGLLDHQYGLYESLVSVPLVVRWPGAGGPPAASEFGGSVGSGAGARFPPRGVDDRLCQHVDLFPTLAALAGVGDGEPGAPPTDAAGLRHSLLEPARREASYAEYLRPNLRQLRRRFPEADLARFDRALRAVRTETYKLIWWDDGEVALYDLHRDPEEARDLARAQPALVDRLQGMLEDALGGWEAGAGSPDVADEEGMELLRDRLEALGYL